jgi:hypothetical protein
MGKHENADAVLFRIEANEISARATRLADTMNDWLHVSAYMHSPMYPALTAPTSDLVEWCRSARDLLEEVARG